MYYIYKIENIKNHKVYIGLTNNIQRRWGRHKTDLRCGRHDNHFLQKEYNIFGEESFVYSIEFEGDVTDEEIGLKEREFIKLYDSYLNGYNQNEGGNFGASNGGSQLTQSDIFNILAVCDFMTKPGQVLANIFGVTRTTISRIKKGVNHTFIKEEYDKLPQEEKEKIYNDFCQSLDLLKVKYDTSHIISKRKLTEEQVFMLFYNNEYHICPMVQLAGLFGVKSDNTLYTILRGKSYQDYALNYSRLKDEEKIKIASQLSNQLKKSH